jgi:hypothetical protein
MAARAAESTSPRQAQKMAARCVRRDVAAAADAINSRRSARRGPAENRPCRLKMAARRAEFSRQVAKALVVCRVRMRV